MKWLKIWQRNEQPPTWLGEPERYEKPWAKPVLEECNFYHSFDISDGTSVGARWDLRQRFDEYVGGVDVSGKSVLDAGTASGFLAFEAEAAGASTVVALEASSSDDFQVVPFAEGDFIRSKHEWVQASDPALDGVKRSFWYMWHDRQSAVHASYGSLPELLSTTARFDVVIAGALLEHLADPVTALGSFCRVSNDKVIIGFTPVHMSEDLYMKPLNPRRDPAHTRTWWVLSKGLYDRTFEQMGFRAEYHDCHMPYDGVLMQRTTIVATRL